MMINKTAERIKRILLMVPIVLKDNGVSISELCEMLDADSDDIISDLNILWFCGVPDYGPSDLIEKRIEGDRVYLESADYFNRPLRLTRDEVIALLVAGRVLLKAKVVEEVGPVGTALEKLAELLPQSDREEIAGMADRIDIEIGAFPGHCWPIIEEAMSKNKTLDIEYYSYSRGEITKREVDPISLIISRGNWYLSARCRTAGDSRLFRIDRIKTISVTDNPREIEGVDEPDISLLAGEYKPGRRDYQVRLVFSGREGKRVAEEWPASQFQQGEGEDLIVELKTKNLAWLSTYLLRFGDRFRIESPEELKVLVRDKARCLLKQY